MDELIKNFRIEMAAELLRFKYSGGFMDFARNVTRRRTVYSQKIQHIRIENERRDQIIAECDACEDHIARIAKETIEQVSNPGRVVVDGEKTYG